MSERRAYKQTCNVARTLDLLGERWSLLIVRELLIGPRRFGDLADSLPGIGTNLLTARLKYLSDEGLLTRRRLPPPASVTVYELTEAGAALEPVLLELVRWGIRHRKPASAKAFYRPTWLVLAMRSVFRPERARGVRLRCEFRVGEHVFHAVVDHGRLTTGLGPVDRPDVVVTTQPRIFRRFEAGERPEVLAKTGKWTVSGERQALERFARLFGLPEDDPPPTHT